jgi:hypothetical protein
MPTIGGSGFTNFALRLLYTQFLLGYFGSIREPIPATLVYELTSVRKQLHKVSQTNTWMPIRLKCAIFLANFDTGK